jgi:hypothetical protein
MGDLVQHITPFSGYADVNLSVMFLGITGPSGHPYRAGAPPSSGNSAPPVRVVSSRDHRVARRRSRPGPPAGTTAHPEAIG